jgi:hypothetical protein
MKVKSPEKGLKIIRNNMFGAYLTFNIDLTCWVVPF